MATETIREFLVALGYKQDEAALKKFEDGINKATKAVFSLAAAVTTTATLVAAGIARFASNLEALYFAAQRTGSSALQLKALDLAARNLGANAGEAQAAVEGLASALRINPGNIGLLNGLLARLGLTLKYNADGSIDSADALLKLSQVFKTMPFFQANQFAQQLGISEHTLYQLTRGNLVDEYTKALKELSAGGFDKAAERAHQFMIQLRNFEAQLEVFGTQVVDALQKKLGISLKSITDWFQKNGPWLAGQIATIAGKFIDSAQWIIDKLMELDDATDGWSTKLIAIAGLLKVSGVGSLIGGVLSLAGAMSTLGVELAPVVLAMTTLYGIWKTFHAATEDQNLALGETPNIVKFKEWINDHLPKFARISQGLLLNNPGNLEYAGQPGAAPAGKGGRWAAFASEGEGLYRLGRQLELYGQRGLDTIQSIISRWAPPGENDTAGYIADVVKRTGFRANQTLNLNDPTVLANLMNAVTWHEQGANPYSPGLVSEEARRAVAANFNQNITFHIDGSGNPERTADHIESRLKQINADLTRSFALLAQ